MKVVFECYQCKWSTVVSTDALGDIAMDHFQEEPEHSVSVRRVNSEVTDLPRLVEKHQKWIDGSRARIIELERLVDLLLVGVVRRGDYTLDELPQLKRRT